MGIFDKFKKKKNPDTVIAAPNQSKMAEMALDLIQDGVMIIGNDGKILFINPAAVTMTGCSHANEALGMSYVSLLRLENGEGREIPDDQNPLIKAVRDDTEFSSRNYVLVTVQGKKTPVAITMKPSSHLDKIITFRNITNELEEEGEQTEFISTASHEMRTPVASIEGYLGLALNPATATIDDRARQYLTEAHNASQHLGRLFRDLLDVTKLDDKRMKLHMVPREMTATVRGIYDGFSTEFGKKKLKASFGTPDEVGGGPAMDQLVYASVDMDFLREILDNLIENAIKYTASGGAVWVNVRGDGDKVLINVTDTGMGIAPDDLAHIFQKFYRVDNSQTRTIGGTGLGLYIAKERAEAMGGRIWAESAFGEGSTFYVSLPRLSDAEYARLKQIEENTKAMGPQAPAEVQAAVGTAAVAGTPATGPVASSRPSTTFAGAQVAAGPLDAPPVATEPTPQPQIAPPATTAPAPQPQAAPTPTPQPAPQQQAAGPLDAPPATTTPAQQPTPVSQPAAQSAPQPAPQPQNGTSQNNQNTVQ